MITYYYILEKTFKSLEKDADYETKYGNSNYGRGIQRVLDLLKNNHIVITDRKDYEDEDS